jgi:hypothetical protein
MNRTLRNGLAVAGMAGGMLFLGQAVASADEAAAGDAATYSADASNTNHSDTTGGDAGKHGGGGHPKTDVDQDSTATNNVSNTAKSGDIDASGGVSAVVVIAGNGNQVNAGSKDGDVHASQDVDTKVDVESNANGGDVTGSNDANAGNGASYDADASNANHSDTTGGDAGKHGDGGDAKTDVDQNSDGRNDVHNEATSGDIDTSGGTSIVEVIAGNGNTLYCFSKEGDVTCSQNITVIINIISQANGGDVKGSNDANAGNHGKPAEHKPAEHKPAEHKPAMQPAHHHAADCPDHKAAAPAHQVKRAAPVAHRAAPVAHRAPKSTTAQPTGELAFTGAETTAPLTLGLIALGAGGALTLAGRRRSTATD